MRSYIFSKVFATSFGIGVLQSTLYVLLLYAVGWNSDWIPVGVVVLITLVAGVIVSLFTGTQIVLGALGTLFLPGLWVGTISKDKRAWGGGPTLPSFLLAWPTFFMALVILWRLTHDIGTAAIIAVGLQFALLALVSLIAKPPVTVPR